jgi:hypothetical protein
MIFGNIYSSTVRHKITGKRTTCGREDNIEIYLRGVYCADVNKLKIEFCVNTAMSFGVPQNRELANQC